MKQLISSSILLASVLLSAGTVKAAEVRAEDFFDFEYARSLWMNVVTRDDMKALYDCHEQDGGVFNAWERGYKRNAQQAIQELETHPQAEAIKRCHDTHLTYEVWRPIYRAWRGGLYTYGGEGWNKNEKSGGGMVIRELNIFTGELNDMPDWRSPKNVTEDIANMAHGNARWLSENTE